MLSGLAAQGAITFTNPIDVAKSKIQAGLYTSILPCLRDTVRDRGLEGLTSGLAARVPRLFLSQAIQFSLVDYFKTILTNY